VALVAPCAGAGAASAPLAMLERDRPSVRAVKARALLMAKT
jgi:hypothetical protein